MAEFEQPWWSVWGEQIITRYSLQQTSVGEWHGPCPSCGGKDRFWIKESEGLVKAFCRQGCSIADMADEMRCDGVWPSAEPIRAPNVVPLHSNPFAAASDDGGSLLYHERKQVDLLGAQLDGDNVVVPLFNTRRERVGYQRISPDGQKRFNTGLDKSGGDVFGVCGKLTEGEVWVAEGWATSAAVAMAMWPRPCIFALDAGTLPKVVEAVGKAFPELTLCVAADNDKKGIEAAKKSGRRWAAPEIEGDDWNDVFVRQGPEALRQGLQRAARQAGLFTHIDDLKITKPEWLIDGLVENNTLAMCFGAAGSGKTFAVLDMALSIATGRDYHGKAVDSGVVFYLCGEGHSGFARRSAAWARMHEVQPGEAKFYKSNRAVIMSEPESVELLRSEMAALVEEAGTPKLVVIDTLARSLGGADENAGKDINLFIVACDQIKEQYGCTVLLVHHTGHQNKDRGRGASQINAALDHEFRIEAWGDDKIMLTFTKQKEDRMPEPMAFVKVPVELMTDDMQEISSIVLEQTHDLPSGGGAKLTAAQSAMMKLFNEIGEHGEVERDRLRDEYINRLGTGNRDSDRSKFNKHIASLLQSEILRQDAGVLKQNDSE